MPGLDTPLGGAAVALLIGLLIGLERQRSQRPDEPLFAGIRTFPLLALAGYLGALAQGHGLPLVLPAMLLALAGLVVAAYLRTSAAHAGATTEVTALVTPLLGALVAWGELPLAAALGVVVTLLLTLKERLHLLAGAISETEIVAILKFAIVAVIVLPLLPAQPLGPYGAIVPRHVGLVVLTLSGLSLAGYLLVRVVGGGAGWALAGLMGGLVSSTAVTLSFAAQARRTAELLPSLRAGIVLACTVLYARSWLLITLFDADLGRLLLPRLGLLFALGALFAAVCLRGSLRRDAGEHGLVLGNPAELGRALGLGLLFALILLGARAAQAELGSSGLLGVAFLGGLTDVDAVALVVVRLKQQSAVGAAAAAQAFVSATLANLLLKAILALTIGGRGLARGAAPFFATLLLATLALLVLG
jgi:uncharacterized membrane protein (DUF4010 family)